MVPFLKEFESSKHVKLHDIPKGSYALILSLHFQRALIVQVTKHEGADPARCWTHGHVIAPAPYPDVPDTFSRDGTTLATALTDAEVLALVQKYKEAPVYARGLPVVKIPEDKVVPS